MILNSVYDSLEYESRKPLKKYRKLLAEINALTDTYRTMSDDVLKAEADKYHENFNIKNKKTIVHVYAIAREVTYRLLGKFQYNVQILGALAALDRNIIQMSTGSGKTITLILPAVAFGMTHRGVNILTVNDYLSERDWQETKPVYDWFGLSNAYTSNTLEPSVQRDAFACDITYSTNSTLGFAYLNSALASDINEDIKILQRPLHAAIIDEADEILMDDARNPLIIANAKDLSEDMATVTYKDKTFSVQEIVDTLKTLSNIGYDDDSNGTVFLDDNTLDEIIEKLGLDDDLFADTQMMHIIYSAVGAIFQYKPFTDYVVEAEPDPDSGSRIVLIDKATGRLSRGRTLSDNMHAFLEMKEHVFTGSSNSSSIQITYQTLFNMFQTIAGVSGTLGTSFSEFIDIYNTGVVVIPDRLPNRLQQKTHLYMSQMHLYDDLVYKTRLYMSAHRPVLIGATSDIEAEIISGVLRDKGIDNKTLVSTDTNEDAVVESAGKPGSVVVTTDIMGRGTDIHVEDVDYERGLVVLQVGARPNSRVERQFAGRAARQGQPGSYHRMLTVPELREIGVSKEDVKDLLDACRKHKREIEDYMGDVLMNGRNSDYEEIVHMIDTALIGSESAYSTQRVEDFNTYYYADLIQSQIIHDVDKYRKVLKESMETGALQPLRELAVDLSLSDKDKRNKKLRQEMLNRVEVYDLNMLQKLIYDHTRYLIQDFIPQLREHSDNAINTVRMSQQVRYEVKPTTLMLTLIQQFLNEQAKHMLLKLDEL
jgi:Preprotein translocase subunit SecA (ATPase, RNA helicase)